MYKLHRPQTTNGFKQEPRSSSDYNRVQSGIIKQNQTKQSHDINIIQQSQESKQSNDFIYNFGQFPKFRSKIVKIKQPIRGVMTSDHIRFKSQLQIQNFQSNIQELKNNENVFKQNYEVENINCQYQDKHVNQYYDRINYCKSAQGNREKLLDQNYNKEQRQSQYQEQLKQQILQKQQSQELQKIKQQQKLQIKQLDEQQQINHNFSYILNDSYQTINLSMIEDQDKITDLSDSIDDIHQIIENKSSIEFIVVQDKILNDILQQKEQVSKKERPITFKNISDINSQNNTIKLSRPQTMTGIRQKFSKDNKLDILQLQHQNIKSQNNPFFISYQKKQESKLQNKKQQTKLIQMLEKNKIPN